LLHDYLIFHKNDRLELFSNDHDFDLVLDLLENFKLGNGLEMVIVNETVSKRRVQSLHELLEFRPALDVLPKANQEIGDAFLNLIWKDMNVH
jgi:hypothetical protein